MVNLIKQSRCPEMTVRQKCHPLRRADSIGRRASENLSLLTANWRGTLNCYFSQFQALPIDLSLRKACEGGCARNVRAAILADIPEFQPVLANSVNVVPEAFRESARHRAAGTMNLKTICCDKEKPFCAESNESCCTQKRRCDFLCNK